MYITGGLYRYLILKGGKTNMMFNFKFGSIYKKSFYIFVVIYSFELLFSLFLYPHLRSMVPMHIRLDAVDSLTSAKYMVCLLPLTGMFTSFILKPEFIDNRYIEGSPTDNILKVLFFLIQVMLVCATIYYFYVVSTYYVK